MKTFTHNVTRVKDPDTGVWNELPSISGKTAYQYALDGGYTGTEEEFKAKMAAEYLTAADLDPYAKTEALSVAITSKEIDEICTDVVDGDGNIPIATKSTIGCVAVGDGLDVDENGTVSLTPTGEVDFIVEQGTSGIWTYRKWNSGIAECWGKYDTTSSSPTYCGSTLPFTFSETPVVTANFGLLGQASASIKYVNASTIKVDMYGDNAGWNDGRPCWFFIHVYGRWK